MSQLSEAQRARVRVIFDVLYPGGEETGFAGWLAGFEQDANPEREIRIYEWVSKSFAEYVEAYALEGASRAELLQLMVTRTMFPDPETCLQANPPAQWSLENVEGILAGMEKFRAECGVPDFAPVSVGVPGAPSPSETPLLDAVEALLTERGIEGTRAPGATEFVFGVKASNGEYRCMARTMEQPGILVFHTVSPVTMPEARQAEAMRLFCQLNLRQLLGSIQLDLSDGEVLFRTAVAVPAAMMSDQILRPVVDYNIQTLDHCHPVVVRLAAGELTGDEAFQSMLHP